MIRKNKTLIFSIFIFLIFISCAVNIKYKSLAKIYVKDGMVYAYVENIKRMKIEGKEERKIKSLFIRKKILVGNFEELKDRKVEFEDFWGKKIKLKVELVE